MSQSKLIVGCGYLGQRVADLWRAQGDVVFATTRKESRFEELTSAGLRPVLADIAGETPLPTFPAVHTVLFAVGFDRQAGADIRTVYVDGLRRTLEALPESVERFIYISSTGVYAQNDGAVVDEDSPTEPTRPGGRACLEAETLLRANPLGAKAIILRLAGIYGPGRVPRLDAIRSGEPLAIPTEGFLNLIHVEDAARIVLLAEEHAPPPRTYLVSDGHPVKRRTYYEEIARRLGAPRLTFVEPSADAPATARADSSKRLDLRRLLTELPVALKYPNYRHGLQAVLPR